MLKDLHRRSDIGLCGDRRDIGVHTRACLPDERRHIRIGDGIGRQYLPLALVVLQHSIAAHHDARRPLLLDHAVRLRVGLAPQRIKTHQREATRRHHSHRQPACAICLSCPAPCQQRGQPDEAGIEFEEVVCIRSDFADADAYQYTTDAVGQCHRQTDRIVMQCRPPTTEQYNASPHGNDQQRPMDGQQFLPKPPRQRIFPTVDIRLDQVQPQIGTRQPQGGHNSHQHCRGTPYRAQGDRSCLCYQQCQECKRRSNQGRFGQQRQRDQHGTGRDAAALCNHQADQSHCDPQHVDAHHAAPLAHNGDGEPAHCRQHRGNDDESRRAPRQCEEHNGHPHRNPCQQRDDTASSQFGHHQRD